VLLENFSVSGLRGTPFAISQCTTFSGVAGDCNSSLFEIEDFVFRDVAGTINANPIASLQCSADAPCTNIALLTFNLVRLSYLSAA
jgi:galacturan 1,4-alpha-galacturonidase